MAGQRVVASAAGAGECVRCADAAQLRVGPGAVRADESHPPLAALPLSGPLLLLPGMVVRTVKRPCHLGVFPNNILQPYFGFTIDFRKIMKSFMTTPHHSRKQRDYTR